MNTADAKQKGRGWLDVAEVGSLWGMRFVFWLTRTWGRHVGQFLVRILALYFVLTRSRIRRVSAQYLKKTGLPTNFVSIHKHVRTFAECTLDRSFFLQDCFDVFEIQSHGHELLVELIEQKKGALLVGAHLGSFEALRASAQGHALPIHVVGMFRNARQINALLSQINPAATTSIIEASPDRIEFVFDIRDRIENGGVVALLADRTGQGPQTTVNFMQGRATFPSGPWILAAALGCPVYLTFGLYTPPNRYDLYCELFAERIVLPPKNKDLAVAEIVQRYAERLEHYCELAPYNWFNFFDFWLEES